MRLKGLAANQFALLSIPILREDEESKNRNEATCQGMRERREYERIRAGGIWEAFELVFRS